MADIINNSKVENEKKTDPGRGEQLKQNGWERRTITDSSRLDELMELYKSLDQEVHLEPLTPELLDDLGEVCKSCYIGRWNEYKVIYTRQNILKEK